MNMRSLGLGAAGAVLALTACAHSRAAPPPAAAEETSITSASTTTNRPVATPARTVHVSEEIMKACKHEMDDINTAPKFDFDRSDLLSADRDVLAAVARCMTTGPLKGRHIELIGRADPRGTEDYNMVLGTYRANAAGAYLQALGVRGPQLTMTSRGDLDARGSDPAGWYVDRRVDVILR